MKIIDKQITGKELTKNFLNYFKTLAKTVVDIEREIIAIDAELIQTHLLSLHVIASDQRERGNLTS